MRYNRKFLFGLLVLVVLLSACTQTPEQRAKDGTVLIIAANADGSIGNGSGFFVEPDKIVTNIHVVDSPKIVFAVGTKKVYNIEKVTGYNPERDLVVLQVSGPGKPLELSEGKLELDEGEKVDPIFAVGYPGGGYDRTEGTVHYIRESDKQLRLVARGFPENRDTVTFPGNSGGPILNSEGKVIGIAVSGDESSNFSYAIASSTLNTLLKSTEEEKLADWQKRKPILANVYKGQGNKKLGNQDYDLAIDFLNESIALYPYPDTYIFRGDANDNLGCYQDAIDDYNKALLNRNDVTAYYNRGNTKFNKEDYVEAIADYTEAITLNTDYVDAYRNRGNAKRKTNDYDGAIQDYTKVINLNPKNAAAYKIRGDAKLESGDYEGAIQDYTQTIKLNPKDAAGYINRGVAKKEMLDYLGAIQDYTDAIHLNPDNAMLGEAYYKLGKARKALGKDESAKLDHAKAYYYNGKANFNIAQYEAAIKSSDKSIALNPDYAEAYYDRGTAKLKSKDYNGAIQDYKKVITLKPDYAEAYYMLGVTHSYLENYEIALDRFEKAVTLKPQFAEAHYNLGTTRYHLDNYKVAIDDFSEAIRLKEPAIYAKAYKARAETKKKLGKDNAAKLDFANAHYHWGIGASERSEYREAIKKFDAILKLDMDYPNVYTALGNAKTKLGKSKADLGDLEEALKLYQAAIEDHDKAIKLDGKDALYYKNRGWTKFLRAGIRDHNDHDGMIGDYESAIEDFTKTFKRKSDSMQKSDFTDTYELRGEARCLLGYAKANQGNSKEAREQYNLALEDFKQAIKLANSADKNLFSYHRGLGLANAALGKAQKAIEAFETAKSVRNK